MADATAAATTGMSLGTGLVSIGAGLAIAGGAIATGMAQAAIGSAAMGVIAERPEDMMKLLVYLALPETIVIFGFVIGIMLTLKVA